MTIDNIEKAIDDLIQTAWKVGSVAGRTYGPDERLDRLKARITEKKQFLLALLGAQEDMYKISLPDDLFNLED